MRQFFVTCDPLPYVDASGGVFHCPIEKRWVCNFEWSRRIYCNFLSNHLHTQIYYYCIQICIKQTRSGEAGRGTVSECDRKKKRIKLNIASLLDRINASVSMPHVMRCGHICWRANWPQHIRYPWADLLTARTSVGELESCLTRRPHDYMPNVRQWFHAF